AAGGAGSRRQGAGRAADDHPAGDRGRPAGGRDRRRGGQGGDGGTRHRGPARPEGSPGAAGAARILVPGRGRGGATYGAEGGPVIVLAGDVGGTNARLATVELNGGTARIAQQSRYPSGDYPGLTPIV